MHVLLTDRLTCPRCGPGFGLILLARRVEERRVLEGDLGCANCRERFPIRAGLGDLRPAPRPPSDDADDLKPEEDEGRLVRLAALIGVARGPGQVVLVDGAARFAPGLARILEDVEVVAVHPGTRAWSEEPGVSRLVPGRNLPFHSGTLRGAALKGAGSTERLAEVCRVVAPLGRVVVLDAGAGSADLLEELGLSVLLEEAGVVVAAREGVAGPGPPPGAAPPGTGPLADGGGRLPVVP